MKERDGDYAAAQREYERAKQLFVADKDPAWEACCLNNLGAVYAAQGETTRSLEYSLRAEAQGQAGYSLRDHPLIATCLENRGQIYFRQRDYPRLSSVWRPP